MTPDQPASDPSSPEAVATPRIDVYWRRGCPYCMSLQRGLRKAGLAVHEIDIWADPDAAAFVRANANGNETVPTVNIAGTVLVNPPARVVLALAAEAGLWSPDEAEPPAPGPLARRWHRPR